MKNSLHEEKCRQALSGLKMWINKLIDLTNETIETARYLEHDHLGFMSLCFLSRQIDHAHSIVTLVPQRDVTLIARTMIEGLCQLLWAAQEPERALKWRAFGYVYDWRLHREKTNRGELIDSEHQKLIEIGLQTYGDLFYTREARSAISQSQPLPSDPYHKDWKCGTQIRQICDCVNAGDLHKEIYSSFSDWHHWGTAGIGSAISWNENKVVFSSLSSSDSAMALSTGFQCLLQSIELTNKHLSLNKESQIALISDGYVKWHQNRDHFSSTTNRR